MSDAFRSARLGRRAFSPRVGDYTRIGMQGGPVAAVGAAVDDVLSDQIRHVREIEASEQAAALARSDMNARDFISRAALDAGDDEEAFGAAVGQGKAAWLENIPEDSREVMSQRYDEISQGHALKMTAARLQKSRDQANADLLTSADASYAEVMDAARDQNPEAEQSAMARHLAAIDARTDLSPQEKAAARLKTDGEAQGWYVKGAFERTLTKRGIGAAEKFLSEFRAADTIKDPRERDRHAGWMDARLRDAQIDQDRREAEARKNIAAANEQYINVLDVGIDRGEKGHTDIAEAVEKGYVKFGSDQWRTLTLRADAAQKTVIENSQRMAWANDVAAGTALGDPGNADYRKGVNASFNEWIQGQQQAGTDAYTINAEIGRKAKAWNMIPDGAAASVRALQTGTPEQQAVAADLFDRLQTAVPHLTDSFAKTDAARAAMVLQFVKGGHQPAEAVKLAAQMTDPANKPQITAREEIFKATYPAKKPILSDAKVFGQFESYLAFDPAADPGVRRQMVDEANAEARRMFLLTGSEDAAATAGLRAVKAKWGETKVGSEKRVMEYPPEAFYGADSHEWIGEQLDRDVTKVGANPKAVSLISDLRTAREASAGAPSYGLWVKKEDGTLDYLGRWKPDVAARKARIEAVAARDTASEISALDATRAKDASEYEAARRQLEAANRSGNTVSINAARRNWDRLNRAGVSSAPMDVSAYAEGND